MLRHRRKKKKKKKKKEKEQRLVEAKHCFFLVE